MQIAKPVEVQVLQGERKKRREEGMGRKRNGRREEGRRGREELRREGGS